MKQILIGIAILALLAFASFCGWVTFMGLSLDPVSFGAVVAVSVCLSPYIVFGAAASFAAYILFVVTDWRPTRKHPAKQADSQTS